MKLSASLCKDIVVGFVVCVCVTVFWAIAILPFLFYAEESLRNSKTSTADSCSAGVYAGSVCSDSLVELQRCLPDRKDGDVVYVSSSPGAASQEEGEEFAGLIMSGISSGLIEASQECVDALVPFMCQYLFPLCNTSGDLLLPSQEECLAISTGVCQSPWEIATQVAADQLPVCADLPQVNPVCGFSGSTKTTNSTTQLESQLTVNCSEDFFLDNATNTCKPLCGVFETTAPRYKIEAKVIFSIAAVVGIVMSILFMVASWIERSVMFTFPSVLPLYSNIAIFVNTVVFIVPPLVGVSNTKMLCTSPDLLQAFNENTFYCQVQGVVGTYGALVVSFFTVLHLGLIFWGVFFPFHKQRHMKTGSRSRVYLHIMCVATALILPVVPVATTLATGGYAITSSPPFACAPIDRISNLFTFELFISISLAVAGTLLVLTIWKLDKNMFSVAERKLLVIFSYIMLILVLFIASSIAARRKLDKYIAELTAYIFCQSSGVPSSDVCVRSGFEGFTVIVELMTIVEAAFSFYPAVLFIFVLNFRKLANISKKRSIGPSVASSSLQSSNT